MVSREVVKTIITHDTEIIKQKSILRLLLQNASHSLSNWLRKAVANKRKSNVKMCRLNIIWKNLSLKYMEKCVRLIYGKMGRFIIL